MNVFVPVGKTTFVQYRCESVLYICHLSVLQIFNKRYKTAFFRSVFFCFLREDSIMEKENEIRYVTRSIKAVSISSLSRERG